MKPLIATRQIPCQSPRDALWLALADTAQLNRAIGNKTLDSEPITNGSARHLVRTKLYGLNLEYEEQPFEWNRPDHLSITRVFRNGPAYSYSFEQRIAESADQGSLVDLRIEIAPRTKILWPFLWINTALIANRLARQVKQIDENLVRDSNPYAGESDSSFDRNAHDRATDALMGKLEEDEKSAGTRLAELVATASDIDVSRIRPFDLANRWEMPRRTMVSVCLKAVVAGLLDLNWDVICPSCRTVASQVSTLSELEDAAHCHLCDISINVDLDRAVEATFRPTQAVRKLENRPYCIGGPFRTPHVVAQATLSAGGMASLPVPSEAGRYRLFARGGASASIDVAEQSETKVEIDAGPSLAPSEISVAPGGLLQVHEELNEDRHVKLEHLEWASLATTAHYVSTLNSFRRLFSAEVLQPGLRVKVTRAALVFTDLTGSAAMYTRLGDAKAYRFVQDHFVALGKVISTHGGTIVKTIGDAIMAVFDEEQSAVKATIAMQLAFREFVAKQTEVGDVGLCVGMFAGPCYLVNANKILDYFGQTVNIANRLQCESEGGQIILPEEIAECGKSMGWLKGASVTQRFSAHLKGLSEPLAAVRVVVDE